MSDITRERFEPTHNLNSGFVKWSWAVMIITTALRCDEREPIYAFIGYLGDILCQVRFITFLKSSFNVTLFIPIVALSRIDLA